MISSHSTRRLHFSEPVTHAAMQSKTKRQMMPRIRSIDPKPIGVRDNALISIPETYHMASLSPLRSCCPRNSDLV